LALAARYARQAGRKHAHTVRLQGAADWDELWRDLTAEAGRLRLELVLLDVNAPAQHEGYHARWGLLNAASNPADRWRAEIPLALNGQAVGRLTLVGESHGESVWEKVAALAPFAERAQRLLAERVVAAPNRAG